MKNRALGSILIVAGTTIGAGMLAMPLATAGVGFSSVLIILISLWAITCYTALLFVEIYQYHDASTGLATLAKQYLGNYGKWLTSLSMLLLMYALTAAYISGAGDLLTKSLNNYLNLNIPTQIGIITFTCIGGLIVCIGTHSVDMINRLLFTAKLIILLIMLALLLPHVQQMNLLTMPVKKAFVLSCIPVIFTSFGFHGSVPSIINYMGGHSRQLKWVFIIGSALPLLIYILWQLATLGAISASSFMAILAQQIGLNGLMQTIEHIVASPHIKMIVHLFADIALATSFLGVSLGLFDYLADLYKRQANAKGRLQTGLITFMPPLIFAIFYPQGFIMALGFAAIMLSVLALLLPSLLAYKTRQLYQGNYFHIKGGTPLLLIIFVVGVLIITIQLLLIFGVLPAVG